MALDACGITGIDHTLVGVRDLEAARAAWARLGFTVTPRGRHIGWGTGNYCIMLEEGYIELLGIVDPSQFSNNLDKLLEQREGLLGLAFATSDANACRDALDAAGLNPDGPKQLKRDLELPTGTVTPEFRLVFLPPESTPEVSAFVCHHLSPELVRRSDWLQHANGAQRLLSVTVVCADPVGAAIGYLPIFGPERIKVTDQMTSVSCGAGAIRFTKPEALSQIYPGVVPGPLPELPFPIAMKLLVADKTRCVAHLKNAGIAFHAIARGCLVPPAEANGAIVEFVAG
ncbi:VOC family protein [Dongia deserti]|uniref:VOC family protein n=1 Tax=Dongia deserti TaxID=2268030 RepID=UPI000E64657F|nr:VOC family protein [Dongia deserti]